MGQALRVKASLGHGANTPDSQQREGSRIGVLRPWLLSHRNRPWDFSLVKLDYAFDVAHEELLRVSATPQSGEEVLGVVGFPADKRSGIMYEAWKNEKRLLGYEAIGQHDFSQNSDISRYGSPTSPNYWSIG
jgi:hypothetical protein